MTNNSHNLKYDYFACMCVCMCITCRLSAHGDQKRAMDPLGLKL